MFRRFKNKKFGFTLLFASLIVSLLLAIGLAILDITYQQLILSSAAKESKFAFYTADSGIECGLYLDAKGPKLFADTTSIDPFDANYPNTYKANEAVSCGQPVPPGKEAQIFSVQYP